MIHTDRDRLLLAVGVTLVFHAALFGGLALAGFDFTPYPETSPVTVTLPDYTPRDPDPVEPEPVEPEPVEPEPDPAEIAPAEPEPADPDPEPAPQQAESEPAPPARDTGPVPAPPSAEAPEPAPSGSDAPPGSFSQEDLRWLNDEGGDREGDRASEDLFAIDEPDEADTELPSWVTEGEFSPQPESSLEDDEQERLDNMRETVPGFADGLAKLFEALDNPPGTADADGDGRDGTSGGTDGTDGDGPPTDPATTDVPGGGAIEWVGSGSRRPIGELTPPELAASDFGGTVPARLSYLVVFEVDEDGHVVPGSLILRQSSGYTLADQKVRRAVSTWRFERAAPGTSPVTAIATLHIARDEIRR